MESDTPAALLNPKRTLSPKESRLVNQLVGSQELSASELKYSFSLIKSAEQQKTVTAESISDNTRINEQELNAAISHALLHKLKPAYAEQYLSVFSERVVFWKGEKLRNYSLQATRQAIRSLVTDMQLPTIAARVVRRIAIGRSQLDDDRSSLQTKRLSGAKETPLRAFKTAYSRFLANAPLSRNEHLAHQRFVRAEVRPAYPYQPADNE